MSKENKENLEVDAQKQKKAKKEIYISKKVDNLYRKIKRRRIIIAAVISTFTVALALYVGLHMGDADADSVKIKVEPGSEASLTLSANEFEDSSPYLSAKAPERITNITYATLPLSNIDQVYGSHNGPNYVAYTFDLKNDGKVAVDFEEKLVIGNTTKGIDSAVRIIIYEDGFPTIYAKEASDGTAEKVSEDNQEDTVPFYDNFTVLNKTVTNFEVDAIRHYTIVIWIEGSDPDCKDNILGGEFKVSFSFTIINSDN